MFESLFLPKTLPAAFDDSSDNQVATFVTKFLCAHRKTLRKHVPVFAAIESFSQLHASREMSWEVAHLQDTRNRHMCAMWLEAQNAVLFVQKKTTGAAILSTWGVQLPCKMVIGHVSSPVRQIPEEQTVVADWTERCETMEVAMLLHFLRTNELDRAVTNLDATKPMFVNEWLLNAFGGESVAQDSTSVSVKQKVRDEVRCTGTSGIPWRRSAFWFAWKSVLRFSLVLSVTERTDADLMYKLCILRLLAFALANASVTRECSDSSILEAARKIVRRQEKLKAALDAHCTFKDFGESTMRLVASAVDKVMKPLQARWNKQTTLAAPAESRWDDAAETIANIDIERDICHVLESSKPHLEALLNPSALETTPLTVEDPASLQRFRGSLWSAENVENHTKRLRDVWSSWDDRSRDVLAVLYDIEESVMQAWEMPDKGLVETDADLLAAALYTLLTIYLDVGLQVFSADAGGVSQIILIAVTLALLVDKVACWKYPILSEHRVGIPAGFLDKLFLRTRKCKEHLSMVEHYIETRDDAARYGPTIEVVVSALSFAVRFALQCGKCNSTHQAIQRECANNQQSKLKEVQTALKEYHILQNQARQLNCTCSLYFGSCTKHQYLSKARNKNVCEYMKLLPRKKCEQWAVVYELRKPQVLRCQRDALFALCNSLCNGCQTSGPIYFSEENRLQKWRTCDVGVVRLGLSQTSSVSFLHCTQSADSFIVDHKYDTVLCGPSGALRKVWTWDVSCWCKVEFVSEKYKSAEMFLNSWTHNENMVIAAKNLASENISLREFESVGMLRAGARLQIPRLLKAFHQRVFAIGSQDIVTLCMAALWQVGPSREVHSYATKDPPWVHPSCKPEIAHTKAMWLRQSCECFRHIPQCGLVMCEHASALLLEVQENWSNHLSLLTIVLVGNCAFEHADCDEVRQHAIILLTKARSVAITWLGKLAEVMDGSDDEAGKQEKARTLVDVACIGALTYCDHACLLSTADDARDWIYMRAVMHDNMSPREFHQQSWRRNLICHAEWVSERIAARLYDVLRNDAPLNAFTTMYWSEARRASSPLYSWKRTRRDGPWYRTHLCRQDGATCIIHCEVLRGIFLVNGTPCTRLPQDVVNHKLYNRFFGKSVFSVQPSPEGGFRTANAIGGAFFVFQTDSRLSYPSIFEERDGVRAQLLPHWIFKGDVPVKLVTDYSHWLVQSPNHHVFFRPTRYNDTAFETGCDAKVNDYVLDLATKRVLSFRNGSQLALLDVRSLSFAEFFNRVFTRLSPPGYVHVYTATTVTNAAERDTFVELPRLQNYRFYLKNRFELHSYQFPGMRVASNQNFGSLVNLRHGLLLAGPENSRKVLMPHGRVSRVGAHTFIDVENLRSPPFFVYTLRAELRDLHTQSHKIAWLYLAHLHAVTSGLLRDPFTESTGTARAMLILRSGRCCGNNLTSVGELPDSCAQEVRALRDIASLSPCRVYYPKKKRVMELKDDTAQTIVENGSRCDLDALCAHDGFALLAKLRMKELESHVRLAGCEWPESFNFSEDENNRSGFLSERSYVRHREQYPKDTVLTRDEEDAICIARDTDAVPQNMVRAFDCDETAAIRHIGFVTRRTWGMQGAVCNERLHTLLAASNVEKLKGVDENFTRSLSDAESWVALINEKKEKDGLNAEHFRDVWITLCNIARQCVCGVDANVQQFGFLVTWLAHMFPSHATDLSYLVLVAGNEKDFACLAPPLYDAYLFPHEKNYNESNVKIEVHKSLKTFSEHVPLRDSCAYNAWVRRRHAHEEECTRCTERVLRHAQNEFGCGGIVQAQTLRSSVVSDPNALAANINALFQRWRRAHELSDFIDSFTTKVCEVESKYPRAGPVQPLERQAACCGANHVVHESPFCLRTMYFTPEEKKELSVIANWRGWWESERGDVLPFTVRTGCSEIQSALLQDLSASYALAQTGTRIGTNTRRHLVADKNSTVSHAALWRFIKARLSSSNPRLDTVGLWDCISPYTVLLHFFHGAWRDNASAELLCGAYAVAVRDEQRLRRCGRLSADPQYSMRYEQERENLGSRGWKPQDYPEFLAFEVDNDVCIREIQAKVTLSLLHGKINCIQQLNMGEGKTAVILPILLCTASRIHANAMSNSLKLVRATVLSSLYHTNASDLQAAIGGLLGRRVYPLLCRRDLQIADAEADALLRMCAYAREHRHVIVTVPEHRLSLENKALDIAYSTEIETQSSWCIFKLLDFLRRNVCDFLDEADDMLSPKYQLIYTLGNPKDMDGGTLRWYAMAAVVRSVGNHAATLQRMFGEDIVEVLTPCADASRYPGVRLLDCNDCKRQDRAYQFLVEKVLEDVFSKNTLVHATICPQLRPEEKGLWMQCVRGEDRDEMNRPWTALGETLRPLALILRGILSHGVLRSILHKRWRVQYGVHPKRTAYHMAVPFRAKDIAAEKTDFGHPDVVLLLTILHYYQKGLSSEQLRDVFRYMRNLSTSEAKALYRDWAAQAPKDLVSGGLESYEGVNVADVQAFNSKLYPAFHAHMDVINFWLFRRVFPAQAKVFGTKVVSTSWDLCRERDAHNSAFTKGFSGTKDLSLVLPLTIRQNSMCELMHTNGTQLRKLLCKENDDYHVLKQVNASEELLDALKSKWNTINVVLDPGALMLNESNASFAKKWLSGRMEMDAAVYFDERNVVTVVTRDDFVIPFAVSPFAENMAKCLLYLDDVHTRGSDFRLPCDTKAILTLGKGMTKDKLVQACMRMRLLGSGQTISFLASKEVDTLIRASVVEEQPEPTLYHVPKILSWAVTNTVNEIKHLFPYFAAQGISYIRKSAVFDELYFAKEESTRYTNNVVKKLAEDCVEHETSDLQDMYGHTHEMDKLPRIIRRQLNARIPRLPDNHVSEASTGASSGSPSSLGAQPPAPRLVADLLHHVDSYAPNIMLHSSMLDEEQERELEHELEEEREVERPPPAEPLIPRLSDGLCDFVRTGEVGTSLIPLHECLKMTSFASTALQFACRGTRKNDPIFVTSDFMRTVNLSGETDWYQKNVSWVMTFPRCLRSVIVSNFEAEGFAALMMKAHPKLHTFAPVIRLRQSEFVMRVSAPLRSWPIPLHACAGSIHLEPSVLQELQNYLALYPRPSSSCDEWDELFAQGAIARDGFVLPHKRHADLGNSPFQSSVVSLLRKFYSDVRHLSDELPTSAVGKLLGACMPDMKERC